MLTTLKKACMSEIGLTIFALSLFVVPAMLACWMDDLDARIGIINGKEQDVFVRQSAKCIEFKERPGLNYVRLYQKDGKLQAVLISLFPQRGFTRIPWAVKSDYIVLWNQYF